MSAQVAAPTASGSPVPPPDGPAMAIVAAAVLLKQQQQQQAKQAAPETAANAPSETRGAQKSEQQQSPMEIEEAEEKQLSSPGEGGAAPAGPSDDGDSPSPAAALDSASDASQPQSNSGADPAQSGQAAVEEPKQPQQQHQQQQPQQQPCASKEDPPDSAVQVEETPVAPSETAAEPAVVPPVESPAKGRKAPAAAKGRRASARSRKAAEAKEPPQPDSAEDEQPQPPPLPGSAEEELTGTSSAAVSSSSSAASSSAASSSASIPLGPDHPKVISDGGRVLGFPSIPILPNGSRVQAPLAIMNLPDRASAPATILDYQYIDPRLIGGWHAKSYSEDRQQYALRYLVRFDVGPKSKWVDGDFVVLDDEPPTLEPEEDKRVIRRKRVKPVLLSELQAKQDEERQKQLEEMAKLRAEEARRKAEENARQKAEREAALAAKRAEEKAAREKALLEKRLAQQEREKEREKQRKEKERLQKEREKERQKKLAAKRRAEPEKEASGRNVRRKLSPSGKRSKSKSRPRAAAGDEDEDDEGDEGDAEEPEPEQEPYVLMYSHLFGESPMSMPAGLFPLPEPPLTQQYQNICAKVRTLRNGGVYIAVSEQGPPEQPILGLFAGEDIQKDEPITFYGGVLRAAEDARSKGRQYLTHTRRIPNSLYVLDGRIWSQLWDCWRENDYMISQRSLPSQHRQALIPRIEGNPRIPEHHRKRLTEKVMTSGLGYMSNTSHRQFINCRVQAVMPRRDGVGASELVLIATQAIPAGTEILSPYNNHDPEIQPFTMHAPSYLAQMIPDELHTSPDDSASSSKRSSNDSAASSALAEPADAAASSASSAAAPPPVDASSSEEAKSESEIAAADAGSVSSSPAPEAGDWSSAASETVAAPSEASAADSGNTAVAASQPETDSDASHAAPAGAAAESSMMVDDGGVDGHDASLQKEQQPERSQPLPHDPELSPSSSHAAAAVPDDGHSPIEPEAAPVVALPKAAASAAADNCQAVSDDSDRMVDDAL